MGRGVERNALGSYGNATSQAGAAYGTLSPQLTQMATNPTGFTPTEKANQLTSSAQSLGGSVAGAQGYGNLQAARTNNIGGYTGALDDAARQAQVVNSQNALGVDTQDAALKRQQQQFGLAGLGHIYSGASQDALGALGQANEASRQVGAANQGWTQLGLSVLGAGQGAQGWKQALGG